MFMDLFTGRHSVSSPAAIDSTLIRSASRTQHIKPISFASSPFANWGGCCIDKEQNAFKRGNAEMIAEWPKIPGAQLPFLWANKHNAAVLRKVLHPEKGDSAEKLTEAEEKAFKESTRGGCQTVKMAGMLFDNSDDSKGQGDRHTDYFRMLYGKGDRRFPDVWNTRFGSHGEAAVELIKHLDVYLKFARDIRLSKKQWQFTNIEGNLVHSLQDLSTLTELGATVIYRMIIAAIYMKMVQGKDFNPLDLGPLHEQVQTHIQRLLDNPDVIFGENMTYATAALDGRKNPEGSWDNPQTMQAVFAMRRMLSHLEAITMAFFPAAL